MCVCVREREGGLRMVVVLAVGEQHEALVAGWFVGWLVGLFVFASFF